MADFEVIFMDAGQGDCTLIVYPDGSLTLVDCGSTKSGSEALVEIQKVIDLKFQFHKSEWFTMVLTHPDEDHYNLLEKVKIEKYFNSGGPFAVFYGGDIELYQNKKDNNYTYNLLKFFKEHKVAFRPDSVSIQPEGLLSRAGVNVTILAANCTGDPSSKNGPKKNSNSIVLLVEYQGAKIFLMGDAFMRTEQFIHDAYNQANQLHRLRKQPGESVVLKMGHHGSDTSTSTAWVDLISPDIVVVSAGTKAFGKGSGMPKESHLNTTLQHCPQLVQDTGITQSYVVYDDGIKKPEFAKRNPTTKGIWTTCYDFRKDSETQYFEAGQTWYYGVEISGNSKKLKPNHWYGYTGYEQDSTDDDDDDDMT